MTEQSSAQGPREPGQAGPLTGAIRAVSGRLPVLAVLVTAGSTPYLHQALEAVAAQVRPPQRLLVVDVASPAHGLGDGTPVEEVVSASGVDGATAVRIVRAPQAEGFLDAVRRGLAADEEHQARTRSRRTRQVAAGAQVPSGTLRPIRPTGDHAAQTGTTEMPAVSRRAAHAPVPTTTTGIWAQARREVAETGTGTTVRSRAVSRPAPGAWLGESDPAGEWSAGSVDAGLLDSHLAPVVQDPGLAGQDSWLWLLHDDCAPDPHCLARLAQAVAGARSVAVAGPKQVDWDHPDELLEVGLRTTASARRASDVIPGEVDQGQLDARSDVLAVGSAGALVSPQAWRVMDHVPADVSCFAEGLTMSQVVRRAGWRVIVVPAAVVRHRRASYLGLRGRQVAAAGPHAQDLSPDPDLSFGARRLAQLRSWARFSPRPLLPLLAWMQALGLLRAAWRLLLKEPRLAGAEVSAAWHAAVGWRRLRRDRRQLAQLDAVPVSLIRELYLPASQIRAARRDRARQERERAARLAAPSELELREQAALASRRRRVLAVVVLVAALASLVGLGSVVTSSAVTGGALASLGSQWRDLWDAAWGTWAPSGDGYAATLSPLLALMAAMTAAAGLVGLDGDAVAHLLLVLAMPLAALGAWYAAGCVTRRTSLRAWAALVWAASPVLTLGVGQGRLAAVTVHLVLPCALMTVARALGADRRDVIVSGLVGAHHLTEAERAALGRLRSFSEQVRADPLGAGAASPTASVGSDAPAQEQVRTRRSRRERGEREAAGRRLLRSDRARGVLSRAGAELEGYGPGSVSAAGLAGLALSVVVACAPASAAVVLPMLLVAWLAGRGVRGRVLVMALPVAATAAPAWWHAVRIIADGGRLAWHEAVAYLLTEPGVPVSVPVPDGLDLLLGLPVSRAGLAPALPAFLGWAGLACGVAVLLLVAVSLPVRGRRGRRVRTGILIACCGYALAALSVRHAVGVGTSWDGQTSQLVAGWSGAGLSLMLAGLVMAALAGADARRAGLAQAPFGWRHIAVAVTTLVGAAVPLVLGGCWVGSAVSAGSASDAALVDADSAAASVEVPTSADLLAAQARQYTMALRPASTQVPVIARQMQTSPAASRVLMIQAGPQGLDVSLWRQDGTHMVDVSPAVLSAQLTSRLSQDTPPTVVAASLRANLSASQVRQVLGQSASASSGLVRLDLTDAADAELASAVVAAAAGGSTDAAGILAGHGVGVVVLAAHAGDETTADARAGLSATPGLDELAQTSAGTSWRVDPGTGQDASRAWMLPVSGGQGPSQVLESGAGEGASLTTQVDPAGQDRVLVLAERASTRWSATLDGKALEPASGSGVGWRQAFTVPADAGGTLVVTPSSSLASAGAAVIWATWILALLVSLPLRRRRAAA